MKGTKPKVTGSSLEVAGSGRPPMPRGLTKDVQSVWKQLVEDLDGAGILDKADWPLVELAAVRIARMRQARKLIDKEGITTVSTRGTVMTHPAVKIEREAASEVRQLLDQLGIGPVGRARLAKHLPGSVERAPKDDVFAQLAALRERKAAEFSNN